MGLTGTVTGGGQPLSGVVVSDGIGTTQTDTAGRFELPGAGRFVMVTQPTGWVTDTWFAPADSAAFDFELSPARQTACRFAQVTDLHLSHGSTAYGPNGDATIWLAEDGAHERVITSPAVLGDLFAEIRAAQPEVDFVIATGDLTNDGHDDELASYADVVRGSPVRVVSIPGNHDHHQAEAAVAAGTPLPYERFVGPRWFSFDFGGVHFVAIDWFTHRLRIDDAVQEAWLAADLELVDADTPVVLLSHDQMPAAFFDRLRRRPVATFSGHWHTTRVVEHAGTLHVNTGPATFGGLDYCPPQYRVVDAGGARVAMRTVIRGHGDEGGTARLGPTPPAPAGGWVASLGGGAHLAGAEVVGDTVVIAGKSEDDACGTVVALDVASGATQWTVRLPSAVKASPRATGDAVVVCTVAGDVASIDIASGRVRWQTALHDDPLYLWAYVRPTVDGDLVFAGDVGAFAAIDAATGAIRWRREDLGQRENLTTLAHPVVVGDHLVATFAGQTPAVFALDPSTGATQWPDTPARCIYQSGIDLAVALPQVVVGGITPDPDGEDVYVIRLGSAIERLAAVDGAVVWSAPFHGWFNPAAPVVVGDTVVASTSTGQVWCYDRHTGARRWSTSVSSDGALAMGSYRADGASVLAGVLAIDDRLLQPTGDGRIVVLDAATGALVDEIDVGAPVVAPLARAGAMVIAVGVDGWVRGLPV